MVFILNRLVLDCTTPNEFVTTLAISRLCNWVSPECVSHVHLQNLKTTGEVASLISDYIRTHRDRRLRHYTSFVDRRSTESNETRKGYRFDRSTDRGQERKNIQSRNCQREQGWQPTCYVCQEKGHKVMSVPK